MTIVPTINPLHLPAGFSLGQAWVFGVMAANAYDPIIARPDRSIIETEITDARTDTRVVVTQYPDSIVLAFRGTVDMVNWLVNLDVVKRGLDSQIKIHGCLQANPNLRSFPRRGNGQSGGIFFATQRFPG